jgi:flavin reductase (DIM6/NTAB) family NADH-FMN oxidoreductase RutF
MVRIATAPLGAAAQSDLRAAFAQYATGVAVVTTMTAEGHPVGITINSFSSLSLDPPLILWCLQLCSASLDAYTATDYFAVNVLASGQEPVARQFATRGTDRFAGAHWHRGPRHLPLLDDGLGVFVCRRARQLPGGDHLIMIGQLEEYEVSAGRQPLVFHGGQYRSLAATAAGDRTDQEGRETHEEDYRSQGWRDPSDVHQLLLLFRQGLRCLTESPSAVTRGYLTATRK